MKKLVGLIVLACLLVMPAHAQDDLSKESQPDPYAEIINLNVDFTTFKLPPLSVLYANALSNPSIKIKEKEKRVEELLLKKQKKHFLTFFNARAGYTYGVTDNYGTMTDPLTPIYTQYTGVEQSYWNVGGNMSINLEELFDLKNGVKRQRALVDQKEYEKQQAYDNLKQEIAKLYVKVLSSIESLKQASEHLTLYKGVSATLEQEYRNRRVNLTQVAESKQQVYEASRGYEELRSSINENLLILEIITHTPILTQMSNTENIND